MATDLEARTISVLPGWKFCRRCYEHASSIIHPVVEEMDDSVPFIPNLPGPSSQPKNTLNISLNALDESPIKLQGLAQHQRKRKASTKLKKAVSKLQSKVAEAYNVDIEYETVEPEKDVLTKAADLDKLTQLMKEKIQISDYNTQIKILTLTPDSWTKNYAVNYFGVTDYQIRKSRQLKELHGILPTPEKKRGKALSIEVANLVESFYQDDEISRIMPGKKDFLSVGKGTQKRHEQKRLLLCNLHEIYILFKEKYPNEKIGFSKFCSLRPKWCISAGSSGTHAVCVCTHHQNTILLLNAVQWDIKYKDVMAKIVCDPLSNECMVHRCSNCPGSDALRSFLKDKLSDFDEDDELQFNQWESTDRPQMITQTVCISDFIDLVVKRIDNLTSHSFIAKCQAKFLKDLKEEIQPNECIVLGDFAENYEFVVQDEIQSYHWAKDSCTLHPIVLYHKDLEGNLHSKSFCFISEDRLHDTCFVYEIQRLLTNHIKSNFPLITKMFYFSDGCAAQYKNYKNFINLCHHYDDFEIHAEWVFFATSHGKSPCDGIGGTVKRTTAKASLQRTVQNQILSVDKMFEFCSNNIKGITFILIPPNDLSAVRHSLKPRFDRAKTIPGTRSNHHYKPQSSTSMGFKRTSEDTEFQIINIASGVIETTHNQVTTSDLQLQSFVACKYDSFWWIGVVEDIDNDHNDAKIRFMHPHGPSMRFTWPSTADICWIPVANVIITITAPTTRSGRIYDVELSDYNKILSMI